MLSIHSMELSADKLMDDVFADIEQMVERGSPWSSESASVRSLSPNAEETGAIEPEQQYLETNLSQDLSDSTVAALAVLPKLTPRQLIPEDSTALEQDSSPQAEPETDEELIAALTPQPEQDRRSSFDKLLFSVILASLLVTAGAWLFLRDRLPKPAAPAAQTPELAPSPQDKEFLTYVQRSLERIDRANPQPATVASNPNSPPTVLERVYIPIYQPSGQPGTNNPTLPPPPVVMTVPAPATSPPVAVAPEVPPSAPSPPSIANISPAPTHVLIGLLELGERSAALFEIDGAPQRIQIGERIGASGWTLASINDQEALIRRNGEVRSIYIGQKF